MTSKELYAEGDFSNWCSKRLHEFQSSIVTTNVGEILEFENDTLKVWSITLRPKEKLPFHKHTKNYQWTCLSLGKAISHYGNGRVIEISYQKGDTSYYYHDHKGDFIHDLENVGDTVLKFYTLEYK